MVNGPPAIAAAHRVLPLEAQREAVKVDLEDVPAVALHLQALQALEETFAGSVLVEVDELQRPREPVLPSRPRRPEDLFVDERDDRVLGFLDVAVRDLRFATPPPAHPARRPRRTRRSARCC